MVRRLFGGWVEARTWTATLHLLLDLPLGTLWFTFVVVLLSTSFGTLVTLIGIPLLLFTLLATRAISIVDRGRAKVLLGLDVADPYRPFPGPGTWWDRCKRLVTDPAAWKTIVYAVGLMFWGIVAFTVTVLVWTLGPGLIVFPIWGWSLPVDIPGWATALISIGAFLVGVLLLIAAPWIIKGLATFDRALVSSLLGRDPTRALVEEVEQLEESHAASVEGAAIELRRIERDLHDGAQQRLVGLAMDLGLARERLERGDDPERVAELVAQAHDESKRAIAELRELVRGIHPSVLTDRGLDAALSAIAARCPIPVDIDVRLERRAPSDVEAAAYFVVAEALTNVAKHSGATRCTVTVVDRADRLVVVIHDDGDGGAAVREGGGLAGLRDRVLAVRGRLRVASPEGGPTIIEAELPLPADRPAAPAWPAPTPVERR